MITIGEIKTVTHGEGFELWMRNVIWYDCTEFRMKGINEIVFPAIWRNESGKFVPGCFKEGLKQRIFFVSHASEFEIDPEFVKDLVSQFRDKSFIPDSAKSTGLN